MNEIKIEDTSQIIIDKILYSGTFDVQILQIKVMEYAWPIEAISLRIDAACVKWFCHMRF
jgi:hypothetical protein